MRLYWDIRKQMIKLQEKMIQNRYVSAVAVYKKYY